MFCALNKEFDRLKDLVELGCKVDIANKKHQTVLAILCEQIDEKTTEKSELYHTISYLLSKGANRFQNKTPVIRRVITKNNIPITQLFVQAGESIKVCDSESSLLAENHTMSMTLSMCAYLIQQGADVNHTGLPLFAAFGDMLSNNSSSDITCLLIEHGADVNSMLNHGPAAEQGLTLLIALQLEAGKDKRLEENQLYHYVKFLLEKGANVNYMDNDGNSALHYAAMYNLKTIVTLLLDHGANPQLRNKEGKTAIKVGLKAGHDVNYIYTYLFAAQERQKTELSQLRSEVAYLRQQNKILKDTFSLYRQDTNHEIRQLKAQLEVVTQADQSGRLRHRFLANMSSADDKSTPSCEKGNSSM